MKKLGDILAGSSNSRFQKFLEIGNNLRKWYLENGYIHTNFGWLHKDWIDMGFQMKAISRGDNGMYQIVAFVSEEIETKQMGRRVSMKKIEKLGWSQWSKWLDYVKTKRETTLLPESVVEETHNLLYKEDGKLLRRSLGEDEVVIQKKMI